MYIFLLLQLIYFFLKKKRVTGGLIQRMNPFGISLYIHLITKNICGV